MHLLNTYNRLPVTFVRGEGVWLWDDAGKRYLDALSGVAVDSLGHCHPAFVKALSDQLSSLIHTSNIYRIANQEALADKLAALSGLTHSFFCNSGAEANEAAIKLARLHGHQRGVDNPTIIVMEKSFHGRTMATLTATGNRKVQAGFEPLLSGFIRVPYNDPEAVRRIAAHDNNVVAVLVEPVLGEGGIVVPAADYVAELRAICDANNWLLMLDEIQTGMGRTGRWFAFQHANVLPDVLTLAKGLGSGFPVGACLTRGVASQVFKPGNHGSTFGGNPLACRAALATIDVIEHEHLADNAGRIGELLVNGFRESLADVTGVVDIRGLGLMIGIVLDRPCMPLVQQALESGLLINVTSENVVRLLPPLIFSEADATHVVKTLGPLIKQFLLN